MQKVLPLILLGLGGLFLVGGILVGWIVFPNAMEAKIREQVRLEPSSMTFDKWRNITTPILIRYYLFNVTNPEEILEGKKPNVTEVGPFVYEQKRIKTILGTDDQNDTVSYQQAITYKFNPEQSVGPQDTVLTILNIPLAAFRTKSLAVRTLAYPFTEKHKETLFLQRTVEEFLFKGYFQPTIAEIGEKLMGGKQLLPNNTFGLYYGKNGTLGTEFQVHRGVRDTEEFGMITKWNKTAELSWWGGEECNKIKGTDGSIFPPFVSRDRVLNLFSEELCRSLYLTYTKDIEFRGIPGYRFALPRKLLARASENEENRCYCENIAYQTGPAAEEAEDLDAEFEDDFFGSDDEKSPEEVAAEEKEKAEKAAAKAAAIEEQCSAGIIKLSACREGKPLAASTPHFLYGEERDVENVNGLHPVEELHETFIDLEPMTGIVLQASKKIQVNVELAPVKNVLEMKSVPKVLLPILWADEYAAMTPEKAQEFKSKVIKVLSIAELARWTILGLSSLLILIGLVVCVLRARNTKHFV